MFLILIVGVFFPRSMLYPTTVHRRTLLRGPVHEAAHVDELLVGNVFVVDVHTLTLPSKEVGRVDGSSAGAYDQIEYVPASTASVSCCGVLRQLSALPLA